MLQKTGREEKRRRRQYEQKKLFFDFSALKGFISQGGKREMSMSATGKKTEVRRDLTSYGRQQVREKERLSRRNEKQTQKKRRETQVGKKGVRRLGKEKRGEQKDSLGRAAGGLSWSINTQCKPLARPGEEEVKKGTTGG